MSEIIGNVRSFLMNIYLYCSLVVNPNVYIESNHILKKIRLNRYIGDLLIIYLILRVYI